MEFKAYSFRHYYDISLPSRGFLHNGCQLNVPKIIAFKTCRLTNGIMHLAKVTFLTKMEALKTNDIAF